MRAVIYLGGGVKNFYGSTGHATESINCYSIHLQLTLIISFGVNKLRLSQVRGKFARTVRSFGILTLFSLFLPAVWISPSKRPAGQKPPEDATRTEAP